MIEGSIIGFKVNNRQTDRWTDRLTNSLTPYKGDCGFFLSVKFATSLLALLPGGLYLGWVFFRSNKKICIFLRLVTSHGLYWSLNATVFCGILCRISPATFFQLKIQLETAWFEPRIFQVLVWRATNCAILTGLNWHLNEYVKVIKQTNRLTPKKYNFSF